MGWFLFFRLLVITLFLGGTIFYQVKGGDGRARATLPFLYLLVGLSFFQALVSLLLLPRIRRAKIFLQTQIVWDLLFAAGLVYLTGGIESIFSFVFLLVLLTGGIFLSRRELLVVASAASILYGSMVELQFYGYLVLPGGMKRPPGVDTGDVFFAVFINVTAFFLTALLVGALSERLRRSEQALERGKIDYEELGRLNRAILGNIPSGLLIINDLGRIRSFNAGASKISGYSLEEVYDRDVREIFPAMRVIGPGGFVLVHRGECPFRTRQGGAGTLGYATSLLRGPQEKTVGLLVTFQDLTALKEMEGQLQRADRLAAVGRLASGMAHEIRNPLASISGSVQLLMEGEHVTEEDHRLMGIVVREADRLSALLTDFLHYARPTKPQSVEVDLAAMLDEISEMVQGDPRFAGIEVRKEYRPGTRMMVDPKLIHQVLWDLAINAAEAMPEGGTLRFGIEPHSMGLYVEDSGTGIPVDLRERIFDPFFTTKERGTGLGLAIVHAIVEAHGGEIAVSPGRSGGTRFTVRLLRPGSEPA